MYLRELAETFATALGVPPIKVVEHHRSIRDGAEAIAEDLPVSDFKRLVQMFNGRPGPTGGFDVDAYGCAFLLTAFLLEGPRHVITDKTANIMCARSKTRCQLTGTSVFGTALATVLCDGAINARVSKVQVAHDGGFAEIHYEQGNEAAVSQFRIKNLALPKLPRVYRIGVAPSTALNLIHQMVVANSVDTGSPQ
jgi:hypothetical protein